MAGYVTVHLGILLTLGILAGCGSEDPSTARTSPVNTPGAPSDSTSAPCAIALAPHVGTDHLDQRIIHFQHEARRAPEPVVYLERLGWTFVAKVRVSFDPGFYKLAEQAARCIASKAPSSPEALLLRGHVLHHLHRFGGATHSRASLRMVSRWSRA